MRTAGPAVELGDQLRSKKEAGHKLLVPYLTCGLPSPEGFVETYEQLARYADAIEVGIAFSDPVMDGPVIQEASVRALSSGMRVDDCFELIARARDRCDVPAVIMTYFNLVHSRGLEAFAGAAQEAGVSGLIVPDLPLEECSELRAVLGRRGMALIQLVAPTTSAERAARLAGTSGGWVYAVSRMGVTGEQESLASAAAEVIGRIKPHTDLPALLGVGISNPDQAAEACRVADGVIVGSALLRHILAGNADEGVALIGRMRQAVDRGAERPA